MALGLEPFYISQFSSNLEMGLQQKDSRFAPYVMTGTHSGKVAQVISRVGTVEMNKITGRLQPMVKSEAPLESRWVSPSDYDNTQYEDRLDLLRTIIDPKSVYVATAVAALQRAKDNEILAALYGPSKSGVDGNTLINFTPTPGSTQIIANVGGGGADTGLNVAKLLMVRQMFKSRELDIDMDPIYMAISAQQEADLLNDIKVINKDYNPANVLVDGRLPSYLGIKFIHSEKIPKIGNNRLNPAWVKSGIYLGTWKEQEISIDQRKDMRGLPWQLYLLATFGATRTDEQRVIQVLNKE